MKKSERIKHLIALATKEVDHEREWDSKSSYLCIDRLIDLVIEDCSNIANAAMYDGSNGPDEVSRLISDFVLPENIIEDEL